MKRAAAISHWGTLFVIAAAAAATGSEVPEATGSGGLARPVRSRTPFEVQRVTGTVVRVSEENIVVRTGEKQYRFELTDEELSVATPLKRVRAGDTVTVWYALDAKGLRLHRSRGRVRNAPGQAPGPAPSPQILLDDRAFFPALNEAAPAPQEPEADSARGELPREHG
ncbi:MAG: hypothetical protein NDJ90_15960 [Oligoflexia bacterium]|nr:hypothetical protein [Oligoflexia bacterium]